MTANRTRTFLGGVLNRVTRLFDGRDVPSSRVSLNGRTPETQFRELADAMPQIVWGARPDGHVDYFNERWYETTGAARGIEGDDSWVPLLHPEDAERCRTTWWHSVETGEPYQVEYRFRDAKTGGWLWHLGRALPVRDEQGRIIRWYGTSTNIDAQKRVEETMQAQARTLETLNRINRSLAAEFEIDKLVQAVTDAGVELTGARFGAFFYNVQNESGESYTLYALAGVPAEAFANFPMPRNTAVFGPTFRGEKIIRLDDVTSAPEYGKNPPYHGLPAGHLPIRSYLAAPVASRSGEVIGGLFFGHEEAGRFDEHAEQVIQGLAAQAAIAIDNARLYRAAQQELGERRKVEGTLRESEERMRFTLDAARVGTWEWQVASGEVRWSDNMEAIHGLKPGTFDGTFQGFLADVHVEDRQRVQSVIAGAFESGGHYRVEYRLPDGQHWVEGQGRVIYDDQARPVRMAGVCTDVTERRRAEEVRFRLAALVESSSDAIIGKSLDGHITDWNRGAERIFGYTVEEAVGRPLSLIVPADRLAEIEAIFEKARRGEGVENLETVRMRKDGRRIPTSLSISPIRDAHDRVLGVSAIERDITEQKAIEENLRRLNEELRQSNQEMEQFVYTVSHDLKSPLVTISGFVGLLREDVADGRTEDLLDSVDRLDRAASRMNTLINDLLQLSRIGRVTHQPERIDVGTLVRETAEYLKPRLDEAGATVTVEPDLPAILADRIRISEVFDNLLTNAIKYGCQGSPSQITIGSVVDGDEVRYFVRDQGPGIPPEYHQRIFGLFQRLESGREGTGVGLAIVARVLQVLGGRAWVESAPGKGATFWIGLPKALLATDTDDRSLERT